MKEPPERPGCPAGEAMSDWPVMMSLAVADRIATLTLSRPPVNAISSEWVAQFAGLLDQLGARKDWTVLRLRSNQKAFCAGADLSQIQSFINAADGSDVMYAYVA